MASDSGEQTYESYLKTKLQETTVPPLEWPSESSKRDDGSSKDPSLLRVSPTPLSVGDVTPCADLYRNRRHHIEGMVQQAKQTAAEARPHQLTCEWDNCGELVNSEDGALRNHLRDKHDVGGGKVHCRWTGCLSNKLMATSSIMNHLKSNQHLRWSLRCPSCHKLFTREDALKRHLSGER
ncbi:hypothetical protein B0H19DRAFT_1073578 [Mycena capillaripes]|nr:hypothetical protein B0H19DRAFT_1073578 [Mycena capillaripes]